MIRSYLLKYFFILFFFWTSIDTFFSQTTGDFRSKTTGHWDDTSTWEYYNGSAWINATDYPGFSIGTGTVTVLDGHTVTLSTSPANSVSTIILGQGTSGILRTSDNPSLSVTGIFIVNIGATATYGGSGTLTLGDIVTIEGTFNNNGVVNTNSTASAALTGAGIWTQGNNSMLNYAGNTMSGITLDASAIGNTVNYSCGDGNQTIYDPVSHIYYHLILSAGAGTQRTKTLSNTIDINGNLTVNGKAVFNVSTFDVTLAGDWNFPSTATDPFIEGTRTITFDGSAPQNMSLPGDNDGVKFCNVTITNTYGTIPQIINNWNIIIQGTLTMISGVVNLNGRLLDHWGSLVHSGVSSAGWMYGGGIVRSFSTAIIPDNSAAGLFPLGNSSEFHPIWISCPTTGPATLGALLGIYFDVPGITPVSFSDAGIPLIHRENSGWAFGNWFGSMSGGTYNLRTDGEGYNAVTSVDDLRLTLANGVIGTAGTNGGTISYPTVKRTGLTLTDLTSNTFYWATIDAVNSPLPIELLSFEAVCGSDHKDVEINWATATETNNDYFIIERSTNAAQWTKIGEIKGAGISTQLSYYTFKDTNTKDIKIKSGQNKLYYRLKHVDFNGKSEYSYIVALNCIEQQKEILVFPNPAINEISIYFPDCRNNNSTVKFYNSIGELVLEREFFESTSTCTMNVPLNNFAKGCYYMYISNQGFSINKKIVLSK